MVKPALPYLDILREVKNAVELPMCAYQVSGEYSTLVAAGQNGWIDLDRAILESLLCIHRAGASTIITYFAVRAAELLLKGE
jgi:porphobilinogen synthase